MPTSLQYTYTQTRDNIINRALRIIGAVGQGETGDSTAITEAAMALNDIVKEWQADGMPLWSIGNSTLTPQLAVATYNVPGPFVNANVAPLKVFQAYTHDSSSNSDSDLLVLTRHEYQMLGNKTSSGTPNQFWYNPPSSGVAVATITLFPVPDANFVTYGTVIFTGQKPFQDFNAAADVPDFPVYFHNALVWGLADQLAYEYGVAFAGRSMITKKAFMHKDLALSFGTEEGSFRIQPTPSWDTE